MTPRKPRKMPKNQRAYPKKGKPRLVQLTERELDDIRADDSLGAPFIHYDSGGAYVKSADLKKWRGFRNTSEVKS